MIENKKIKNATSKEYDGIKFKSLLEVYIYKYLKEEGFNPEYEKHTFTIWEGFIPNIPFYTRNKFKAKNKNIKGISCIVARDDRPIKNITYTPDFVFQYNGKTIIIEAKGMENDVFPYKFKMFRKLLETDIQYKDNIYEIWEVFTKKQLVELINNLKNNEKL